MSVPPIFLRGGPNMCLGYCEHAVLTRTWYEYEYEMFCLFMRKQAKQMRMRPKRAPSAQAVQNLMPILVSGIRARTHARTHESNNGVRVVAVNSMLQQQRKQRIGCLRATRGQNRVRIERQLPRDTGCSGSEWCLQWCTDCCRCLEIDEVEKNVPGTMHYGQPRCDR